MLKLKNINPNKDLLILDLYKQSANLVWGKEREYIETDEVKISYEQGSIRKFIDKGWIEVINPSIEDLVEVTRDLVEVTRTSPFLGDENIVSTDSENPTIVKQFLFIKNLKAQVKSISGIRLLVELKSQSDNIAIFEIYINNEASPRARLLSSAREYQVVETEYIDLSDLDLGVYDMFFKLSSSIGGKKAYNRTVELYIVR